MIHSVMIAGALLLGTPSAAEPDSAAEAAIPFVGSNGIADWKADGDRDLYIKSIGGHWYHARMMGRCGRLRTAISLGFETSALDQLDRHGAIRAEGWRCPIRSLTRSGPPPKKKTRR